MHQRRLRRRRPLRTHELAPLDKNRARGEDVAEREANSPRPGRLTASPLTTIAVQSAATGVASVATCDHAAARSAFPLTEWPRVAAGKTA